MGIYILHERSKRSRRVQSTVVGILTCARFLSSCGNPYLQPRPLGLLPSLPTLFALMSSNLKSHRTPGTCFVLASNCAAFRSWESLRCFSIAAIRSACRCFCSSGRIPAIRSLIVSIISGWGIRSSAGSSLGLKTLPASVRVKCRDSEVGWKICALVDGWTGKSLIDSWRGLRETFGFHVVFGSIAMTASLYCLARGLFCGFGFMLADFEVLG